MARQLRVGAAASNITPMLGTSINGGMLDRRARHIHDQLHAKCLVIDNGQTRVAFVVCDSCMIPRELIDRAKQMAAEHIDIPVEHILVSATHTHSAPTAAAVFQSEPDPKYTDFLVQRIADGLRCAVNNLERAELGWAVGEEPTQVFNRRWFVKNEQLLKNPFGGLDRVRMNPPRGSKALVKPAGPTDPEVPVLYARSTSGRPLALLANYSLHYVGGTGPGHISADYFGMFADRMQYLLGADRLDPAFVGIMSNGTSGDINNIDFTRRTVRSAPYVQMRRVAYLVADAAWRAMRGMEYHEWLPIRVAQEPLVLKRRLPTGEEVDRARAILARSSGPPYRTREEIYANETVQMADWPETIEILLQVIRLGDLAVVAIPCEVFVEIGLKIKRESPIDTTFTIELANGYAGYLPTAEQHALGGYETWRARSSFLEVEADRKIYAVVRRLLDRVAG